MSPFPFESDPGAYRPFNEILLAWRDAPPKQPLEAAAEFIYELARAFLRRELGDRHEQILKDFEEASREIVRAAEGGATVEDQVKRLKGFWARFRLPEPDLRKRRDRRGPSDAELKSEVEALHSKLGPILRRRNETPTRDLVRQLRELAPWASKKALKASAEEPPKQAAYRLIGSRYALAPGTVRNRISRASKGT